MNRLSTKHDRLRGVIHRLQDSDRLQLIARLTEQSATLLLPLLDGDTNEIRDLYINLSSKNYGWSVNVYTDCENTIRWMRENGLMSENVTIQPHGSSPRYY